MKKKIITLKICRRCGSELIFSRSPGWGTITGKWICTKCKDKEKNN